MQAKLCNFLQLNSSTSFQLKVSSSALNQNGLFFQSSPGLWPPGTTKTRPSNRRIPPKHVVVNILSQDIHAITELKNPLEVSERKDVELDALEELVGYIRNMMDSIRDGRTTVSPYDTAWLALIRNLDGSNTPQFPSSLEWIVENQLEDGSWGDALVFSAYDRLLNTLACVVALNAWGVQPEKYDKGITFIKESIHKLESENAEHMTCGFEVIFPALLERAANSGIDLPYDARVIKDIEAARERKLKRIPDEVMHNVPTSLLFSLEGLKNLNWEKLLKLQTPLGSFLTSPSSTAFAFMVKKDASCLKYLTEIADEFNGGAPASWPVDLFPRLWAIDRLQRLGISRFFSSQIREFVDYVYGYWTGNGIFSGRYSKFSDIDDTSMGFRLLRLNGYNVNPGVFKHFMMDGNKFSCFGGQMIESSSPIFNLYRASQFRFPGEEILEKANEFSYKFLQDRLAAGQLFDKWIISEGLKDEISYGLEVPWYVNLPRVESRFYIEQYGGANDVWIGKTLYRMPDISNNMYLDLAKLDYNRCQRQHQTEWKDIQEWYASGNFQEVGISWKCLLFAYFLAASSIFEPERLLERVAWAKSIIISKMITSYFNEHAYNFDQRTRFISKLRDIISTGKSKLDIHGTMELGILTHLAETINQISMGVLKTFNRNIKHLLHDAWESWMVNRQGEAELLTTVINICGVHTLTQDILLDPVHNSISGLTNEICQQLNEYQNKKVLESGNWEEIEKKMQRLLQLVLDESSGIPKDIRQTFLVVARTYYYAAYFEQGTIDMHMVKVLFEEVT